MNTSTSSKQKHIHRVASQRILCRTPVSAIGTHNDGTNGFRSFYRTPRYCEPLGYRFESDGGRTEEREGPQSVEGNSCDGRSGQTIARVLLSSHGRLPIYLGVLSATRNHRGTGESSGLFRESASHSERHATNCPWTFPVSYTNPSAILINRESASLGCNVPLGRHRGARPNLVASYMTKVQLTSGSYATVDDAFVYDQILNPTMHATAG